MNLLSTTKISGMQTLRFTTLIIILLSLMILMAFSSRAQEEALMIQDTIPSEWLEIKCIDYIRIPKFENNLILSEEEYYKLSNYMWETTDIFQKCEKLPEINFDDYSLVLVKSRFGGCLDEMEIFTYYGTNESKHIINIKTVGDACKADLIIVYFVKIPKINQSIPIQVQERGRLIDFW